MLSSTSDAGTFSGNVLELNTESVAFAADRGGGAGINVTNVNSLQLSSNTIRNNVSTGYGGAIFINNSLHVDLYSNLVYQNTGLNGAVAAFTAIDSFIELEENTITQNSGLGASIASDVFLDGNTSVYFLSNNIIQGTIPRPNGARLRFDQPAASAHHRLRSRRSLRGAG